MYCSKAVTQDIFGIDSITLVKTLWQMTLRRIITEHVFYMAPDEGTLRQYLSLQYFPVSDDRSSIY